MTDAGDVVRKAILGMAALLLAGCSSVGPAGLPVADTDHLAGPPKSEYVIGPGDQISVFVYQSPQLSMSNLPVRPDGRVSLPLIPDIQAAGKTPTQLSDDIAKKLEKYVRDPNVTVMVQNFVGPYNRQIRVIGEAADPQSLPYREGMTLLDVMIQTKGLTKFAAGNRAVIVRRISGKQKTIPVHLSDLVKDGDVSQNMPMRPGDILIIPQSWF